MDNQRQSELSLDLGGEQILLESVEADESLSRPFSIILDVIAPLGEVDLLDNLGKPAAIKLMTDGQLQRYFHGHVVSGELRELTPSGWHYRLILAPWTYFLEQNQKYEIHQELSALDIIKKVLEKAGGDVDYNQLSGSCGKREYCVQYGESDWNFVSRLMEDEGIYYHFRHESDKHILVLCNGALSHHPSEPETLEMNPMAMAVFNVGSSVRGTGNDTNYLQAWSQQATSGGHQKVTLRDFDFKKPEKPIEAVKEIAGAHAKDSVEHYEYPGGYIEKADGETLAETALDAFRAQRLRFRGETQATSLRCGTIVKVEGHHHAKANGTFLIVRTMHSITAESYRTGDTSQEDSYNVVIEAIPSAVTYRAPQNTPRPIVYGLESAIVCGGEPEVYTDEYGRVKVRFHWDRSATSDDASTCWIRVSQTGGLGNNILPRIGHEVLVDFLGGDPDRPVVVGRVFNQSNMPCYDLPTHKTRAIWRSKSFGPGSNEGKGVDTDIGPANEIHFEDKDGGEEFFQHAQRDMVTMVRRNEKHQVGLDQEIHVLGNRNVKVDENEKVTIQQNQTIDVKQAIKIDAGTTIDITAVSKITLTVGSSKITIDPGSIKIESPMITVDGKAKLDAQSPMTTVKGTGILTLQGGLVKIN